MAFTNKTGEKWGAIFARVPDGAWRGTRTRQRNRYVFTEWEEGKGRREGGHAGVRVPEGGRMLAITRRELHQEKEGERSLHEGEKGARNEQKRKGEREKERGKGRERKS